MLNFLPRTRIDLIRLSLQVPHLLILVSAEPEFSAAVNYCHILVKMNHVVVEPKIREWGWIDIQVTLIQWLSILGHKLNCFDTLGRVNKLTVQLDKFLTEVASFHVKISNRNTSWATLHA